MLVKAGGRPAVVHSRMERRRPRFAMIAALALAVSGACASDDEPDGATTSTTAASTATSSPTSSSTATATAAVDLTALPIGDGKHSDAPRAGYVFTCSTRFGGGGAFRDGPWIDAAAKTWDASGKLAVRGSVDHQGRISVKESGGGQVLTGNGLPTEPTGVFPVASTDPAYQYDRNPNTVQAHPLSIALPEPRAAATSSCVRGTIGVSVLGVPIFSAFDALGRDAAAHEVQDACGGHPERTGQYHYHSLSPCWGDVAGFDPGLFGYALDGFGIYVERTAGGGLPASADLDECHGRTSEISWHGAKVSMYHYVATADFPYLVGCYRGTPIASATGLQLGGP